MDVTSDDVQNWILNKASDGDLKLLQEIISMKMRIQFRIGDTVSFDAKTRGIIHGTIIKMNGKSFKVKATSGMEWKVAPSLLQKSTPPKTGA